MTLPFGYDPEQVYRMTGGLVNRRADKINALAGGHAQTYHEERHAGVTQQPPMGPVCGVMVITNTDNDCLPSPEINEENTQLAPCRDKNLYLGKLRAWDNDAGEWVTEDDEYPLDAGALWEWDEMDDDEAVVTSWPHTSRHDHGAIESYSVGDVVPVWWDTHREAYVPCQKPFEDPSSYHVRAPGVQIIPQPGFGTSGPFDSGCEIYIEVRQPGGAWKTLAASGVSLPHIDMNEDSRTTRSGQLYFEAAHKTEIRFRCVASYSQLWFNEFVAVNAFDAFFWGHGRRGQEADWKELEITNTLGGGMLVQGWSLQADTVGRYDDSPYYIYDGSGAFRVEFKDTQDRWIIGLCWVANIVRNGPNFPPLGWEMITEMSCGDNEVYNRACKREFKFPPGMALRMIVSGEDCLDCDQQSQGQQGGQRTGQSGAGQGIGQGLQP
jgi:hypothetical protein